MQYFKPNDLKEIKMVNAGLPPFATKDVDLNLFYEQAYLAYPLGDILWSDNRAPLSNAILQSIFRESFPEIFDAFVVAGSFESYLTVFRKIFGDDVEVDFTVPAPGKLNIDIVASGFELSDFVARRIEDNAYIFDNVVTQDGDQIVFQTVKGFSTQYELEQMLHEMVPAGIFTDINLTVGEE